MAVMGWAAAWIVWFSGVVFVGWLSDWNPIAMLFFPTLLWWGPWLWSTIIAPRRPN